MILIGQIAVGTCLGAILFTGCLEIWDRMKETKKKNDIEKYNKKRK